MKFLYNLFIIFYSIGARVFGIYNAKARKWVLGRKNIFSRLEKAFENNTHKVVWMHCASLGEFEQGRPVIEKLKEENSNIKILITFFSPSGYEVQKNYSLADWVFYLPIDSRRNANHFFDIVKPSLIIYIKYEFWYYYLREAKLRNINLLLVSGIFRESQPFFKWYGSLYREMLNCFTHLFVQGDLSYQLAKSIYDKNKITICGDTRMDRVVAIASKEYHHQEIEKFIGNSFLIVAGSTWREDDLVLDHFANTHSEIKFLIAPHEIIEERLIECLTFYKNVVLLSKIENIKSDTNVIIVDNVGMLRNLYRYASVNYIGGGFGGDGVHNVLEAAVYKKPVVFGPVYEKYKEAVDLVNCGAAISIESAIELEQTLNMFCSDKTKINEVGNLAGEYVVKNQGATKKIIDFIYANRLLIS